MRKSPNPAQMTIWEVADALGYTKAGIKKFRLNPDSHPFFRKAFKTGGAPNSPLRWWRADVEEYLREVSGRGIDGAA
jgi:hypothetical protein